MELTTEFKLYIAGWMGLCMVALAIFMARPASFHIGRRTYWHFLTEPWKLLSFVAATALITLIAPYTGDPTWDYIDALFMSVLCYASAPWVVAVLYLLPQRRATWREGYLALCAWLFTASWSYDIYLVWRDGVYPITWWPNLWASSVIYLSAGMFWNLEWVAGRGVIFSFMREGWPSRAATSAPARFLVYAAILALPILAAIAMFFV